MAGGPGAQAAILPARPWVGRHHELAELERALEEALAGRSHLALISGDPGIGKTCLAREMSDRARERGLRTLWGRCWEGAGTPAYWPWVQILRGYVRSCAPDRLATVVGSGGAWLGEIVSELRERLPGTPDPPFPDDSEKARFFLFDAASQFFGNAAAHEPLLLTIDDLHRSDPASLLLLRFLVRQNRDARILVLATCREPGPGSSPEAARLLGDLRRESLEIPLRGFGPGEVAAVLAACLPTRPTTVLVQRVHDVTDGNPFFVDEVARWLAVEGAAASDLGETLHRIPEGIRQAIRWRLSVLSPECLEVLSFAAVIGRSFDLLLLRDLAGLGGAALVERLGEASGIDVVRPSPDSAGDYWFLQGLVREILYEDFPAARRVEIHRRIGEILERRRDETPLAALAHHFSQAIGAGCAPKAVEYCFRAGRVAEAQLAWEEAARCFSATLTALDHAGIADDDRRGESLIRLGENQCRAGDRGAATRSFLRAIDLARRNGEAELQARAALGLGTIPGAGVDASGRVDPVLVRHLEGALGLLPTSDSPLRARLLGRLAAALYWAPGSTERRIALTGEAVAMAQRMGDKSTLAATLHSRRYARWGPDDLEDRHDTASQTLHLAREAGDRERELQALQWRLWDLLELGRVQEALRDVEEHERLARSLRQPFHLGTTALFRALFAIFEGRHAEARELSVRAFELGQEAQSPVALDLFGAQTFVLAWEEGRLADLEGAMSTILSRQSAIAAAQSVVPFVLSELGRSEAARGELERLAVNDFHDLPRDLTWLPAIAALSLSCANLGDVRRARLLYEKLHPYRDRLIVVGPPPVATLGPAQWVLGRLAQTTGALDLAEEHLDQAIRAADRWGSPGFCARATLARAAVRADRGDPTDAARMLEEGLAAARALGMGGLVAQAEAIEKRIVPRSAARRNGGAERSLRREGDFWLVGWEGQFVRVEDAKGIRYLARLLRDPGTEFHVTDLMKGLAPEGVLDEIRLGHAGDDIDARAAADYRRRLQELEQAHATVADTADADTLEALRTEAEFIRRELAVAHGLGGRRRRSVDDVERLRKTVSSRIRQSAERIAKLHPTLGVHLREAVQTGTFCAYRPRKRVEWTVEE